MLQLSILDIHISNLIAISSSSKLDVSSKVCEKCNDLLKKNLARWSIFKRKHQIYTFWMGSVF